MHTTGVLAFGNIKLFDHELDRLVTLLFSALEALPPFARALQRGEAWVTISNEP